jgi:hypothetical protein
MHLKISKRLSSDVYTRASTWCILNNQQKRFSKKLPGDKKTRESRFTSVFITGEFDSPVLFAPTGFFRTNLRRLASSLGSEYTGESIANWNYSSNIRKH